jgi:hypothetical protein
MSPDFGDMGSQSPKFPRPILQRITPKYAILKSEEKPKARFPPEPGLFVLQTFQSTTGIHGLASRQPITNLQNIKSIKKNYLHRKPKPDSQLSSMCACEPRV